MGVAAFTLSVYQPTQAHCDSEKGPVATAAHQASKLICRVPTLAETLQGRDVFI
jgi:hypothetical protein